MYFTGWLAPDSPALQSAYMNAKAFILPSFNETFGNVVFEAGICGANLIISKNAGILDFGLDNYCEIVSPGSKSDILKKCHIAIGKQRNPELPKFIINQFDWDAVGKKYLAIYQYLLNERRLLNKSK